MKIKCEISFKGTNYCGWQVQNNGTSVQKTMCDAAYDLFGRKIDVCGCSRTDSGVHAYKYVCALSPFDSKPIDEQSLPAALNFRLPDDISVKKCEYVDDSFHPRYSAKSKTYTYVIFDGRYRDPFSAGLALKHKTRLDEKLMADASAVLVGKHDFSAFMAKGSDVTDAVRTVKEIEVLRNGDFVRIRISADGFLYNMVRIIVGTLVEVSEGKKTKNDVLSALESKDRKNAGRTADACGLYLTEIEY